MDEQKQAAPAPAKSGGGDNDTLMGILAYIGILVIIPIVAGGDSKFVKYHANQGLVLLLTVIALYVVLFILGLIPFVGLFTFLLWILVFPVHVVFAIIGIINVTNKAMKPLPVIGGITLLKS